MQAVCDALEALVAEGVLTRYALGGATAAGFHGEPLATRDVDVFVFLPHTGTTGLVDLSPLFAHLAGKGFHEFEGETLLIHGFPVQFLLAASPLESEAVHEALEVAWDGHRLRVMRPEHLAAIALTVGRPKDRARVVYLVTLPQFDRTLFQEITVRHGLTERWKQWATALDLEEKHGN